MFFFVGIFFLMVFLRDKEPLKSRKLVPFFAAFRKNYFSILIFCKKVQMTLIIISRLFLSMGYEKRLNTNCVNDIFTFPWVTLGLVGGIINMSRFILIVNIGRVSVNNYTISQEGEIKISWKYRILVYLNSFPVIASAFVISYVLFMLPYLIGYLLFHQVTTCDIIVGLHLFIISLHILLLSLMSATLLIVDLIYNIKLICKCRLIDYFFRKDRNLFRIETLPNLLIAPIMFSVLIPGNTGVLRSIFYYTTYNLYLFYISGGFVLIATIVNLLFQKFRKSKEDDIGYVFALKDEKLRKVFMKFAEKEYNIENILIKLDIMEYKEQKKEGSRKDLALKMQKKFLSGELSEHELNMEENKRINLIGKIEKEEFGEDLFKEIDETVNSNLLDMFNRFKLTKDYIEYRDIHRIKNSML